MQLQNTNTSLSADRIAELTAEANEIAKTAPQRIASATDVAAGQSFVAKANKFAKKVEGERMEVTRVLDQAKKALIEQERQITSAVTAAAANVNAAMTAWLNEQERIRQEAERKARIEAERKQAQFQALATLKANILRGFADMTAANAMQSVERLKSLNLKPEAYGERLPEAQVFVSEQIAAFQARATELLSGAAEQLDQTKINAQIEAAKDEAAEQAAIARFEAAANVPAAADVKNVRTVETWTIQGSRVVAFADLIRHYLRTGGDESKLDFLIAHAQRTMSEAPEYIEVTKQIKANAR